MMMVMVDIGYKIMKNKILTIVAIVLVAVAFASCDGMPTASNAGFPNTETSIDNVYICTGSSSKKYHKTAKCRGLEACKKTIKKISISEAEEKGRTPCKKCYKQ